MPARGRAPSASSRSPRSSRTPRLPECGFTVDGRTCRQRGDHFCRPRARHAVAFCEERCRHTKDKWARRRFLLASWQRRDIIEPLFGTVVWDPEWETYVRRYQIAWLEVARKNGKSELLAFIALYLLVGDCGPIRGGSLNVPLCARCVNPAPKFWGSCPVCATTWQLGPQPCQRCALDQRAHDLLGADTGVVPDELAAFHQALVAVERPDSALAWLARPKVRDLLRQIGNDARPLSHELLDELPADKTLAHLRSVLVATGALLARDERVVVLERWITEIVQGRKDLAERQILHGYAVWHHLRRLRRCLGEQHTTRLQDLNVRCHVTAAAGFLDWLGARDRALAACTQADLDTGPPGSTATWT